MILIFGGAYQGKTQYAMEELGAGRIFDCRNGRWITGENAGTNAGTRGASSEGSPGQVPDAGNSDEAGPDGDVFGSEPDFSGDGVCGLEAFVRACAEREEEAADWFHRRKDLWADKILIVRDISQGIVPVDGLTRAAREMNGRLMLYLAGEADQVIRVFCGIGKRIR